MALITAHNLILDVLDLQKEQFKLAALDKPLKKCLQDFRDIWKGNSDNQKARARMNQESGRGDASWLRHAAAVRSVRAPFLKSAECATAWCHEPEGGVGVSRVGENRPCRMLAAETAFNQVPCRLLRLR